MAVIDPFYNCFLSALGDGSFFYTGDFIQNHTIVSCPRSCFCPRRNHNRVYIFARLFFFLGNHVISTELKGSFIGTKFSFFMQHSVMPWKKVGLSLKEKQQIISGIVSDGKQIDVLKRLKVPRSITSILKNKDEIIFQSLVGWFAVIMAKYHVIV